MDRRLGVLGTLILSASAVLAQEASGPPKVLAIAREEIKPGKGGAHAKSVASFIAAVTRANAPVYRIGLTPVSGDDNAVVYLQAFASFAEVEAAHQELEKTIAANAAFKADLDRLDREEVDQHASQRTAYYTLRSDLSYHPRTAEQTGKSRFMSVNTTRIKPGRLVDYADYIKALNVAREKAGADVHTAVYQVLSGAPTGTFLSFTSLRSLAEIDDARQRIEQQQKAIDEALGGPDVVKQRRLLLSEIVADGYNTIYAMEPSLSRPTAVIAAADPDFWNPKPAAATKALAAKKAAPKAKEAAQEKEAPKP
ncbi:MAG TPA: hypothetical protein VGN09_16670 [Vicinamibacteria bacterium]